MPISGTITVPKFNFGFVGYPTGAAANVPKCW